ncbi:MAG TPA: L,D-transpeptidase family protein [Geobacteraceae bacterium]|nr:L,D-transpeptidase family protein [Geobacteraceae bacterium]
MKKLVFFLFLAGCASINQNPKVQTAAGGHDKKPPVAENAAPAFVNREYYFGDESVIGMVRYHKVRENESLIEIARMYNLGFNGISDANRGADPFVPPTGLIVQVPTEWILPDVKAREGIVINISEMRLYFFPRRNSNYVYTFPIGIGDDGKETPVGNFRVIQKKARPYWVVPKSIKQEDPNLPNVVPPGPDNPLGTHALRLSMPSVLIHGTNKPWGIGRKVSHGCIHLYPEDIPWLFDNVKTGTQVKIIRQPVKAGVRANRVYLEVHDNGDMNYLREALAILARKKLLERVDSSKVQQAVTERSGIPTVVSN